MPRLLPRPLSCCLALMCALLASLPASAAPAAEKLHVVMGTATPGGGFPVFGDAVVRTIAKTDTELEIDARNTKGSAENIPLLEQGKLDIGLVQGESAHEAFSGIGRPPTALKIIAAMYATPGMFVVRADSPYRNIEDLRGKPVAFGARGSGLVILARYVLNGMGLDMDKDFQAIYLDRAGDGPPMLADGKVAALWGGGASWPGFVTVANSPAGARFIVPGEKQIAAIRARHSFLQPLTLPANTFKGQNAALSSVGSWSFIMARPDLPEQTAYRLTRALHLGEKQIGQILPQASETTAANTAKAAPADKLHPGTVKYLQEIGLK